MEGVVSRSGRTSSRYGPATVFSGPVRKWKKRWVPVSPSNHHNTSNGSINNHNPSTSSHINRNGTTANGITSSSNGNNSSSHLMLYKWTALSQANCNNNNNSNHGSPTDHSNGDNNSGKDDDSDPHEPPRRKFKYVPVDLLEKQKEEAAAKEAAEKADDEAKLIEVDPTAEETVHKAEDLYEKPDINDTPMEEIQDDEQGVRQDLNESTLDLSLGLNSHDVESDSKPDKSKGQLE